VKKTKAYVCFHQGWTDVICFLPKINYYHHFYDKLVVFFREEVKELVEFYVKDMRKVKPIYLKTNNGANLFQYTNANFNQEYDFLCHGQYDVMRKDNYRYASRGRPRDGEFFVQCFYEIYNIDYMNRIDCFEVTRDYILEEKRYNEFIKEHGKDYIVYHDMPHSSNRSDTRDTRIQFEKKFDKCRYVNLHRKTNLFFDYIKIIQNSKEAHFVDSVWAALCYQLDAKYSLFQNIKINIHCKRGHYKMFSTPVKLNNWNII